MKIGEKLRRRRKEKRLTLQQVGEAIGVSRNAVHLWETGDTTRMKLSNRIALSEKLDLPLVELLPPEAAGRDLTVRDPQEILLIERFRGLLPQQREAYLRLLVVMHEVQTPEG